MVKTLSGMNVVTLHTINIAVIGILIVKFILDHLFAKQDVSATKGIHGVITATVFL